MRVAIDHVTRYQFSQNQRRLVQQLHLTPGDSVDQTVTNWDVGVSCDARLRDALDGFGNRVTMVYAEGPIAEIEITVTGEVLTGGGDGMVRGTAEPLPPEVFLRQTDRTTPNADILAFAQAAAVGDDARGRIATLADAVHAHATCEEEGIDSGRDAADVFAATDASPRDLAHLFVAAARAIGIPARYVSGYRASACGAASAPHAWVEAHAGSSGWLSLDPCHGGLTDERYIRVAVALDAGGAAPVMGSRTGSGDERLDVDLSVEKVGNDA